MWRDTNEDFGSINLWSRCICRLLTNCHIPITTSIFPAALNDRFCDVLLCVLREHRFLILARTNNESLRWCHKFKKPSSQAVRQRGFLETKPGIIKGRYIYVILQWRTQATVLSEYFFFSNFSRLQSSLFVICSQKYIDNR
jgi:hypothetical protein